MDKDEATIVAGGCLVLLVYLLLLAYWPFFLAVAAIGIVALLTRQICYHQNKMIIQSSIVEINDKLHDQYFISLSPEEEKPWIAKLNKIYYIENNGKFNIKISTYELGWDEDRFSHISREACSRDLLFMYKFTDRNIQETNICSYSTFDAINNQNISNKILNVLTSQDRTFVECETVDHKLCKILFDNWPEAQWAIASMIKLKESLEKISTIYNNSLDNELLSGYTEKTYKTLKIIENEIKKVDKYATESYDAMRKSYEYLCVPSNMKTFEGISLDPLRVSLRQDEMRKSFDEVVKIQDEINLLS